MPLLRLTLILFTVLSALSAAAQQKNMRPEVVFWTDQMKKETILLKSGLYEDALKMSNLTIADMAERLGPGQSAAEMFGIVLTHKALAHAGLKQNYDARWYWQTALTLYPKLAKSDLSSFGEAGKFLKANMKRTSIPSLQGQEVSAPKAINKIKPHYPAAAHHYGVSGTLVVEVVINTEGRVESPKVVKALAAPTLSFVALETLRQTKFEPAKMGGKAVPVIMELSVGFKP